MSNVLILTMPKDEVAWQPVAKAILAKGGTPWVVRTDRYPMDVGLTWRGPGDGAITMGDDRLPLADISAIWARREAVGLGLPEALPANVRKASIHEARHVLQAALLDTDAFWLDPPAVYQRGRHKALQLRLAREVGLTVPATLETNDPDEARRFVQALGKPVIAKMHVDFRIDGGAVFTNRLAPDDLEALDSLALCPMILQEDVPKAAELRVVVVGRQLFALELDHAHLSGDARTDWRRVGSQTIHLWKPVELPEDVRDGLLALHDRLGTNYGSADLIRRPDGTYVLLENNVVGESFWFYDHVPLADALADLLLGNSERRPCPEVLR